MLIGIIVYKEKALRTPINILIVNMAISDLLLSIIYFPARFVRLNTASHWPLSGPLGQALCKNVLENPPTSQLSNEPTE